MWEGKRPALFAVILLTCGIVDDQIGDEIAGDTGEGIRHTRGQARAGVRLEMMGGIKPLEPQRRAGRAGVLVSLVRVL
jgi:hypothetical protein